MSLENLKAGIYFLKVVTEKISKVEKIIKE
jgi:hypothetical protein